MPLSRRHALILLLVRPRGAVRARRELARHRSGRHRSLDVRARTADRIDRLFSNRVILHWTVVTIFWAVLAHLIGRSAGGVEVDERDLRLRHLADRARHTALMVIVIIGVCLLATLPETWLDWWLEPIVLANVLIGLLMAKVFVENLVLTYSYRAGSA